MNYRSTPAIIKVLNHIYNNADYAQGPSMEKKTQANNKPRLILTNEIAACVEQEEKTATGNVLKLYVTNKERFGEIGALGLYEAVEKIENENGDKLYGWGRKYSVADVMTLSEEENPEAVFRD